LPELVSGPFTPFLRLVVEVYQDPLLLRGQEAGRFPEVSGETQGGNPALRGSIHLRLKIPFDFVTHVEELMLFSGA